MIPTCVDSSVENHPLSVYVKFSKKTIIPRHKNKVFKKFYVHAKRGSSPPAVFFGEGVLKMWNKFRGEYPC